MSESNSGSIAEEPKESIFQKKMKQEAYLTRGCGTTKIVKIKIVDTFWTVVWPQLEKLDWKKVEKDGKIYFVPPGNHQGYDRVKDVIERIKDRKNKDESDIADEYESAVAGFEISDDDIVTAIPVLAPTTRRKLPKTKGKSETSGTFELKFKVKHCSEIGPSHQCTRLPKAGTYDEEEKQSSLYSELVWDFKEAERNGIAMDANETLVASLPANIKEAALLLLAATGYDEEAFKAEVQKLKPTNGSDWTREQKETYHKEIYRLRKDLGALCKKMEIPMTACWAYYLGSFKPSDDYRLLKTVLNEEHSRIEMPSAEKHDHDECAICGDGGNLLICDGCDGEFHMDCLKPPLESVPEGRWECDECVDSKFLATRTILIRETDMFQMQDKGKRSIDEVASPGSVSDFHQVSFRPNEVFLPNEKVLEAVRKLGTEIGEALRQPKRTCTVVKPENDQQGETKGDSEEV